MYCKQVDGLFIFSATVRSAARYISRLRGLARRRTPTKVSEGHDGIPLAMGMRAIHHPNAELEEIVRQPHGTRIVPSQIPNLLSFEAAVNFCPLLP